MSMTEQASFFKKESKQWTCYWKLLNSWRKEKNVISRLKEKRISFNFISAVSGTLKKKESQNQPNKKFKLSLHQVLCNRYCCLVIQLHHSIPLNKFKDEHTYRTGLRIARLTRTICRHYYIQYHDGQCAISDRSTQKYFYFDFPQLN